MDLNDVEAVAIAYAFYNRHQLKKSKKAKIGAIGCIR